MSVDPREIAALRQVAKTAFAATELLAGPLEHGTDADVRAAADKAYMLLIVPFLQAVNVVNTLIAEEAAASVVAEAEALLGGGT